MKVYCPKCNACYDLDEQIIANKSRKLRCSNCSEVFVAGDLLSFKEEVEKIDEGIEASLIVAGDLNNTNVEDKNDVDNDTTKEDVVSGVDDPSADENSDDENATLDKIFERLSEHTENLIEKEKKLPIYEKVWLSVKNILGFHFKIKWVYLILGCVLFVMLSLYNNRYEVVREFPFLNSMYKALGIKAKIPGEGLEFQNINWNFLNDEDGARLEIKGFINNTTDKEVLLPTIHIEILDRDTVLLQSQNRVTKESAVAPKGRISLNLIISNPAPTAKYIYLTFIDKN